MSKLPDDFKHANSVGGYSMAANNAFVSGKEPEHGHDGIAPFGEASSSKGKVDESVLSTKGTVIGGTSMAK